MFMWSFGLLILHCRSEVLEASAAAAAAYPGTEKNATYWPKVAKTSPYKAILLHTCWVQVE